MEFLLKIGFSEEEIKQLNSEIPPLILEKLNLQSKLIMANLMYLKEYGIDNYKDIFFKFYEVFLLDYSEFKDIFEKYEKEDLINYLKNNVDILQYL